MRRYMRIAISDLLLGQTNMTPSLSPPPKKCMKADEENPA
jgi:hypothetical protein